MGFWAFGKEITAFINGKFGVSVKLYKYIEVGKFNLPTKAGTKENLQKQYLVERPRNVNKMLLYGRLE